MNNSGKYIQEKPTKEYRIYKYPVAKDNFEIIQGHKILEILDVGIQEEDFVLWAIIDPDIEEKFCIRIMYTGEAMTHKLWENLVYLKTLQIKKFGCQEVIHIFKDLLNESS